MKECVRKKFTPPPPLPAEESFSLPFKRNDG